MKPCPVCASDRIATSVRRDRLPIFQNVVWPNREAALAAPSAPFLLGTCADCGFSFNAAFDGAKVVYDERYDNGVPSPAFRAYYQSLVDGLVAQFGLTEGAVYDVGCGKGEFLEMLCASAPGVRGIGIDPSCTPAERGNFRLVRAFLEPGHFAPDTRLVILRHVLEHIEEPVAFLTMLRGCMPNVPLFIEVPDLGWMLRETAFWDFCYEHCNYFTPATLGRCLAQAGFAVDERRTAFGGQYQWALCRPAAIAPAPRDDGREAVADAERHAAREAGQIDRLAALAAERGGVALWGMATKGVVLAAMLGPERVIGGIDGNPAKQGRFAAGSGVAIHPPAWSRTLAPGTPTLVMNPNYAAEIGDTVRALDAPVRLMTI